MASGNEIAGRPTHPLAGRSRDHADSHRVAVGCGAGTSPALKMVAARR